MTALKTTASSLSKIIFKFTDSLVNLQMKKNGLTFHEKQFEKYLIRYWDSGGDKPVLILLQAFTAEGKFTWRKQVKAFGQKFRLVIPNLLYFGGSTATSPDYSVSEQVNAIDDLLNHLGINSFFLCGASYGGIVALELALSKSERVKKLIILGTPIKFLTEEDRQPVYEKYGADGKVSLLVPDNHRKAKKLLGIAYKNPPPVPLFIFKSIYENLYVPQSEDRKKLLSRLENEEHIYNARNYQYPFPVLLIWGEEDHLVPLHVGKKLKEHIGANTILEIISGTTHLPNLEKPKIFNEIVLAFLGR
jgi:pimeloyl-ACP methyl ester carboxylesterase